MIVAVTHTRRPVAGMPGRSPECVARMVERVTTLSPLGDLVLDGDVPVGKRLEENGVAPLIAFGTPAGVWRAGIMVLKIGAVKLFHNGQIAPIKEFLVETAN